MKRMIIFAFGIITYLIFLLTFLYFIGFIGEIYVPKTINSGDAGTLWFALIGNLGLIAIFGLQHSIMARGSFKNWLTSFIPPHSERSVYVLLTSCCLLLIFALWQPIPQTIWNFEGEWLGVALEIVFWIGWLVLFISTFMIDHFNLFGLRQSYNALMDKKPKRIEFQEPGFYSHIRHPLMFGFLLIFWAAPHMTWGRMLFALGMTTYILIGVMYEERDLIRTFGARYEEYRERVPKFIPFVK